MLQKYNFSIEITNSEINVLKTLTLNCLFYYLLVCFENTIQSISLDIVLYVGRMIEKCLRAVDES